MRKVEKTLLIISILWFSFSSRAQTNSTLTLEAHFSAIIVTNIDNSIAWYTNTLGFEVINKIESEERGFKQSNLKRGDILIELIELDSAVNIKDVIPNYHNKTRIIGFFKTGYLVSNFDEWTVHLTSQNVDFYGNVVTDSITKKRMTIVLDPDGNRIQIFEK